ncbi:MAG: hypothetical protein WC242_04890 [Candidatus Paceibacterota bacterium]|jgi:hypothetical protein
MKIGNFKIGIFISIIFGVLVFFFLGYAIGKTPVLSDKISSEQIQKEFATSLRQVGILRSLPQELKSVTGNVSKIDKNLIVIQPKEDQILNPLGSTFPKEMKFNITRETVFSLAHEKNQEEFIKEYEAYQQELEEKDKAGEPIEGMIAPEPFTYEDIKLENLKISDQVRVVSDQNLLVTQGSYVAKSVSIMNEVGKLLGK